MTKKFIKLVDSLFEAHQLNSSSRKLYNMRNQQTTHLNCRIYKRTKLNLVPFLVYKGNT